jgi:glycosyltransferase involved in cell wall biosynthesis
MENNGGESMKKKVLLRAPVLSKSGYGEHSRQILKYLLSKENIDLKVSILPWGITPWYLNQKDCEGLIGKAMSVSNVQEGEYFDVSFQVQLPNEWNNRLANYNVGVTAGVETDISSLSWSESCNSMDMVIVPSQFTKKSLMLNNLELENKIKVVPETYFKELENDPDSNLILDLNLKTDFNFLTIGVLTGLRPELDRKNTFYLIKWFLEEFKDKKNVGLIIKTNQGRESSLDYHSTLATFKKLLKELNHTGYPKIYLLHGDMNRETMNQVYKHPKIKGFLTITRGEGFGLPILEAAAAGLPVLATNWSAHPEFLNNGNWIKFDYELKNVSENKIDGNIFVKNAKWAEVKEQDFKSKIRKFRESYFTPTQNAKKLSNTIKKMYCWESLIEKYDEALKEII